MNDTRKGFRNNSFTTSISNRKGFASRTLAIVACMAVLGLLMACGCEESTQKPTTSTKPVQETRTELPKYSTSDYMMDAIRIISQGLDDENSHIRTRAVEVVIETHHVGLMPKVQNLLTDRHVPVRFLATLAVGDLEYKPAEPQILKQLKDPDVSIKIVAAYAMAKLGHDEYHKILQMAVPSNDQELRANAILMLGKYGDPNDIPLINEIMIDEASSDMVTLQCVESLAQLGDESIYQKLWTRLISKFADDRMVGLRGMGLLGIPRAKDALILQLEDEDNFIEVRVAAAEQLGRLGDPMGEPEVMSVFEGNILGGMSDEEARRVKVLAASAIGEIGTDKLTRYLPNLLKDRSVFVRMAAAKAVFRAAMKAPTP